MEARPLKSGFSYRYHPVGRKPIPLGRDRLDAIRKVLDLNGDNSDRGTVNELWRLYQLSAKWARHAESTRLGEIQCSVQVLKIFGAMPARSINALMLNRYMRQERADAPVRANRELALLSNLMRFAINRGDLTINPCREVERNEEEPRTEAPNAQALAAFLEWAEPTHPTLAAMAEFAALVGARRMEFINLQWPWVGADEVRLIRGKQRGKKKVVDVVAISPALAKLLDRLRARANDPRIGPVFPTLKANQPYTESGFKAVWARLMQRALKAGIVTDRFTFHDLRAYYTTQHQIQRGALPNLHANPGTTARVYERGKEAKRGAL